MWLSEKKNQKSGLGTIHASSFIAYRLVLYDKLTIDKSPMSPLFYVEALYVFSRSQIEQFREDFAIAEAPFSKLIIQNR